MKTKKTENSCPICYNNTTGDDQHDAKCEKCGFNIVKKKQLKPGEA